MKQYFEDMRSALAQAEAEIFGELQVKREAIEKDAKEITRGRRTIATRAKNIKAKEDGFAVKSQEVEDGLKRIRKNDALTKFEEETNQRLAQAEAREKDVTERESVVKATLEELEARQIKFNETKRDYKKKLEQEIVDRFLKK